MARDGETNGTRLKTVQGASTEPKIFHLLLLREWRQHYQNVSLQLYADHSHVYSAARGQKFLCEDIVCRDFESVRCCRNKYFQQQTMTLLWCQTLVRCQVARQVDKQDRRYGRDYD